MKRTPLKRKTPLRASRIGLKRSRMPQVKRRAKTRPKRPKLPKPATVRNKADLLLTPIIKLLYPNCLLRGAERCAGVTQVAHHHVHKSSSSALRYEIMNLVPLCGACHALLHANESYWGSRVTQLRGLDWFNELQEKRKESVKTDVHFYLAHYARLKAYLSELQGSH
jgi:hypothetical protein